MHPFPWPFLLVGIILFGQLLQTWAACLNLGRMQTELPREFLDIFSPRDYSRSQEYSRVQTKFDLLRGWFWAIVIITALMTNLFNSLDIFIRQMHLSETCTGLLFFLLLFMGMDILGLPFEIYHTFRLEERFGVNRTTVSTFLTDKLKGYLLTVVLGGILAWPLLVLLQEAGSWAWLYCTLAFGGFVLIMQYVGPTLILPMFNKFSPIEDEELRGDIFRLAEAAQFPLREVYIVDGSKRSSKGNAFFAGMGKARRIALFDTLLNKLTQNELLGVLAHEIGHFRLKHVYKGLVLTLVKAALLFALLNIFIRYPNITASLGIEHHSVHASVIFFALLYSPVAMLLGIAEKYRSRKNEYEADAYAATLYSPGHLVNALKKLGKNNLGNLTPHPVFVFLHLSHPPVLDRIESLKKTS